MAYIQPRKFCWFWRAFAFSDFIDLRISTDPPLQGNCELLHYTLSHSGLTSFRSSSTLPNPYDRTFFGAESKRYIYIFIKYFNRINFHPTQNKSANFNAIIERGITSNWGHFKTFGRRRSVNRHCFLQWNSILHGAAFWDRKDYTIRSAESNFVRFFGRSKAFVFDILTGLLGWLGFGPRVCKCSIEASRLERWLCLLVHIQIRMFRFSFFNSNVFPNF